MKYLLGIMFTLTLFVFTSAVPNVSHAVVSHYCAEYNDFDDLDESWWEWQCVLWVIDEPDIPNVTDIRSVRSFGGDLYTSPQNVYQNYHSGTQTIDKPIQRTNHWASLNPPVCTTTQAYVLPDCIGMAGSINDSNGATRKSGSQLLDWHDFCITASAWYKFLGTWVESPGFETTKCYDFIHVYP